MVLERTVCELQGECCIPTEEAHGKNKHQIICSRSFGNRVSSKQELRAALASFISRACEKLRAQSQFACEAILFIRTDPFRKEPQYCQSIRLAVPVPTNDTRLWLVQLEAALEAIYQDGVEYKKAGFILMDLSSAEGFQGDLLSTDTLPETSAMMTVLDQVNQRYGRHMLKPASIGFKPMDWHMNQQSLSKKYTTKWEDILDVRCY